MLFFSVFESKIHKSFKKKNSKIIRRLKFFKRAYIIFLSCFRVFDFVLMVNVSSIDGLRLYGIKKFQF